MAKYKPERKLGRPTAHREATLRNLTTALLHYEKIRTTKAKAKELKRYAEKVITSAKRNDLNARRAVERKIKDPVVFKKIFEVLVPRYQNRLGGYMQIFKLPSRGSDNAPMCLIRLVS